MTTEITESCVCDEVLTKVLQVVSNTTKEAARIKYTEETNNKFLDHIIELKETLTEITAELNEVTASLEQSTWQNCTTPRVLELWADIFAACKGLRKKFISRYILLDKYRVKGIAAQEILSFKHALDDFTETFTDVEFIVFELPRDNRYTEVTKKLEEAT